MTDREERQHVIEVLQKMVDWMESINYIVATPERRRALEYAIASIKTDLRYDLLYEETSEQADKPITKNCESCRYYGSHHKVCNYCYKCSLWTEQEPTTKNDLVVDAVSRQDLIDWLKNWTLGDATPLIDFVNSMPSVTPQFSSGLDKNSKKLEKDFGESDCISREQALRELKESAEHHANDSREEVLLRRDRDIIRALPSVTPQEPKPMVEIDLYSVIKQKYIERDVLDKIRAEIKSKLDNINRLYNQDNQYDDGAIDSLQYALDIIDKYKAETEKA